MKILIITRDVGHSAPGIVYERLIHGFSQSNEVDVICANYQPLQELTVNKIYIHKCFLVNWRITALLNKLRIDNPLDILWGIKASKHICREYDIILSLISFNNFPALFCGKRLSKKLKIKHATYCADAIPAPDGWLNNKLHSSGAKYLIRKHTKRNVDGFFSSNETMMNYQLPILYPSKKRVTSFLYNPSNDYSSVNPTQSNRPNDGKIHFLYTGRIYGARNPQHFFKAFSKLIDKYPNVQLDLVGPKFNIEDISSISNIVDHIKIHPFTTNLIPFFIQSDVLIDIDAELDNDVFISSKITNYITINKPIISETNLDSPSSNVFKGIPSIIQCEHNSEQIYLAMLKAIETKFDYTDRAKVIKKFDINTIVEKALDLLNQISKTV